MQVSKGLINFVLSPDYNLEFITHEMLPSKAKPARMAPNESKSLWNYTLSPGWTDDEVFILKLALQKFGIGQWKKITASECLPGKSIGQIHLQTQRIMGQQSLGDFKGLHVDIERVFMDNMRFKDVKRKNNCIINMGDNPKKEESLENIEKNRARYGLSTEYIQSIKLPRSNKSLFKNVIMLEEIESPGKFTTIESIHHMEELRKAVDFKLEYLSKRGEQEYKPTFKNKGAMVSEQIEYQHPQHAERERKRPPPVTITLHRDAQGKFRVV